MKVLYDHQVFSSQEYGGISRYFFEVGSRVAAKSGVDGCVLCPWFVNNYLVAPSALTIHGGKARRRLRSAVAMRTINAMLSPLFVQARKSVDIYHETYFTRFDLSPRGSLKVVTVHDMVHELFPDKFPAIDPTRGAKRAAILRADHVICVSENTRRDLLCYFDLDPSRISVVHHGSSLSAPRSNADRECFLLFVGARGPHKNFQTLLQAFASSTLPKEGFSLVCLGGGPFNSSELRQIDQLGLAGSVEQRSGRDEELVSLFRAASALVYPSLYEGFGIPPLEAMSCGCPVICSNTGSLPEVVGDAAQLFCPNSLEELRFAMESVAYSPSRISELIDAGYVQAARFSWDESALQTLKIYTKITQ